MNKKSIVGMLDIVAKESPDPSTKVGCLLTDEVGRIVIAGYNHMPRGCEHFSWSNDQNEDYINTKYPYVVHAEMDAILKSYHVELVPVKAYVSYMPCAECTKALIQFGIKEIYYTKKKDDEKYNFDATIRLCEAAHVTLAYIGDEE